MSFLILKHTCSLWLLNTETIPSIKSLIEVLMTGRQTCSYDLEVGKNCSLLPFNLRGVIWASLYSSDDFKMQQGNKARQGNRYDLWPRGNIRTSKKHIETAYCIIQKCYKQKPILFLEMCWGILVYEISWRKLAALQGAMLDIQRTEGHRSYRTRADSYKRVLLRQTCKIWIPQGAGEGGHLIACS